jgi:hypothetical protein
VNSPRGIRGVYYIMTWLDYFGDMTIAVTCVLLLQHRGLTSSGILQLLAAVWLLEAFLEIPTGIFADRIGRRPSVILSFLIRGLGYSLLFFSHSPVIAILGTLTAATGGPFASGALDAWAVDRLAEFGDNTVSLDAMFTRSKIAESAGIVSGVMTGAIAGIFGLAIPQIIAGAACAVSALASYLVVQETRRDAATGARSGGLAAEIASSARSVVSGARRTLSGDRAISAILLLAAGLCLLRAIPGSQWTVHFREVTSGSLIALGVARSAGDLLQIPLLMVVAKWVSGARRLWVMSTASALAAGAILASSMMTSWLPGITCYVLFILGWGMCQPGIKAALNARLTSGIRATVLSTGGMLNALFSGIGVLILGVSGVGLAQVRVSWTAVAAGTLVVGLGLAWVCGRPRIPEPMARMVPAVEPA